MGASARRDPLVLGVVVISALLPASLAARFFLDKLGANPIEAVLNQLGLQAVWTLLASLSCTPLAEVFGLKQALRVRKTLGLAAFFAALAHLSVYLVIDQGLAWSEIWADVTKRRFIFFGSGAFLLLLPLALTSTKAAVKRLGQRNWKRLHRLVYAAGLLGCLHYFLRFKLTEPQPVAGFLLLAILLGARVFVRIRRAASASRATARLQ